MDKVQVFFGSEPSVPDYIPVLDPVVFGQHVKPFPHHFVFGHWAAAFDFALFFVVILLGLFNNFKSDGQCYLLPVRQGGMIGKVQNVDPFDGPVFGMIPMVTDDFVFCGMGLFRNRVVNADYA